MLGVVTTEVFDEWYQSQVVGRMRYKRYFHNGQMMKNEKKSESEIEWEKEYNLRKAKEGANKRGNSSRLTQSFHFFMFEPIFSPVNALNQPI